MQREQSGPWSSLILAAAVMLSTAGAAAAAGVNAGDRPYDPDKPFTASTVARFNSPWAIAFLPDDRMLVTEKPGKLYLVTETGDKTAVSGVPDVAYGGQNGLLDVAVAPDFATSRFVYLSYVEPGRGGGSVVLARARLDGASDGEATPQLADLAVIWRQTPAGGRGQPGGIIAFAPDGRSLYLSVGDRMLKDPAEDLSSTLGKVLHLALDGKPAAGNPFADRSDASAAIYSFGHRNPYGLAFAPDGRLWLHEMGPAGGDEFNLIVRGGNYGWPVVSNGDNYDGTPIPRHDSRPDFLAPQLYWNPVIAPAGLVFHDGKLFTGWKGSALVGGLASQALIRIGFEDGAPREVNRWNMEHRIRDVAEAPDGSVWVIEDEDAGRLLKLVPKQ